MRSLPRSVFGLLARGDGSLRILGTGNMAQSDARWSTVFTVDDIRTDASSLITRLRLAKRASPQFAYSLLTNRESLVIHR